MSRIINSFTVAAASVRLLALYIAIVGPPALAVALPDRAGRPCSARSAGSARRSVRRLLGIRLDVSGLEHVDGDRPTLYCINHRSNVDVVAFEALFPRCPRLRGLYKAEMGKLPVLGRAMRLVGFVPVDRGNRASAIASVDAAAERLRAGDSFLHRARRHARADRRDAAVQEGRVRDGHQGPGAGRRRWRSSARRTSCPAGGSGSGPGVVRVDVGAPIPTAGLTLDGPADGDGRDGCMRRLTACSGETRIASGHAVASAGSAIAEIVVVGVVLDRRPGRRPGRRATGGSGTSKRRRHVGHVTRSSVRIM